MTELNNKEIGVLAAVVLLAFVVSLFLYPSKSFEASGSSHLFDSSDGEILEMAYFTGDRESCDFLHDETLMAECLNKARHGEIINSASKSENYKPVSLSDKELLAQAMNTGDPVICQSIVDDSTRLKCEEATA